MLQTVHAETDNNLLCTNLARHEQGYAIPLLSVHRRVCVFI